MTDLVECLHNRKMGKRSSMIIAILFGIFVGIFLSICNYLIMVKYFPYSQVANINSNQRSIVAVIWVFPIIFSTIGFFLICFKCGLNFNSKDVLAFFMTEFSLTAISAVSFFIYQFYVYWKNWKAGNEDVD